MKKHLNMKQTIEKRSRNRRKVTSWCSVIAGTGLG